MVMLLGTSTVCDFGMVRESSGFGSTPTRSLSKQLQIVRREILTIYWGGWVGNTKTRALMLMN